MSRSNELIVALGAGALGLFVAGAGGCAKPNPPAAQPSILLVTLDTTRADATGPAARGVTPHLDALAARGRLFRQAYTTAPETLPAHASMMTGLYPAGHLLHENGRFLATGFPVVAETLQARSYGTAAFVSAFVLSRQFGLARGFDTYDDRMPEGRAERGARETTDRALAWLERAPAQPVFLWVHYFDPHHPYEPPEPFRTQYASAPYLGEVAAMDAELGRLLSGFERLAAGPHAIVVAGDHGEGLGDHGEAQHGYLAYQATMHVPLVVAGPGLAPAAIDTPVSIRRIFHTVLDWSGAGGGDGLGAAGGPPEEVVLGEAMKPFLEFGWQPQVMAVSGRMKGILTSRLEVYDVEADPGETRDLSRETSLPPAARAAIEDYPLPSPAAARPPDTLDAASRQKLASLGYVSAGVAPTVRKDAPRPTDMAHLFDLFDRVSGLFVRGEYAAVAPLLERIIAEDPHNLDATLRLATAWSALGRREQALAVFRRAAGIAPRSTDVRLYLALHYARGPEWAEAIPLLEYVLAETPERLPALEALEALRERQGRMADAAALRQRLHVLRPASPAELVRLGRLAMASGQTEVALASYEQARTALGAAFAHDLELGVLYLAVRRLADARDALDRVPALHPEYPMALFKRAQVSVLLGEPDRAERVARARRHADATTRELIAKEKLFEGIR